MNECSLMKIFKYQCTFCSSKGTEEEASAEFKRYSKNSRSIHEVQSKEKGSKAIDFVEKNLTVVNSVRNFFSLQTKIAKLFDINLDTDKKVLKTSI